MLTSKASSTNFKALKGAYSAPEWHNSTLLLPWLVYHLWWRWNVTTSNSHESNTLKPQLKACFPPTGVYAEHCSIYGSYLCMWISSLSYVLFWFLLVALVGSEVELNVLLLLKNQRSKLVFISELPTFISSYNIWSALTLFWFSLSTEVVTLSKKLNPAKPANRKIWKHYRLPGSICSSRLWLRSAQLTL